LDLFPVYILTGGRLVLRAAQMGGVWFKI